VRAEREEWGTQVLIHWDLGVGVQGEGALGEHSGRKVAHNGFGLEVEVAEHLVGAPSTDKADDVGVDRRAEERHGAGGAEEAGGNVLFLKPIERSEDGTGGSKSGRDVSGRDGFPGGAGSLEESGQRGVGRGVVGSEVDHTPGQANGRGKVGIATVCEPDDLASNAVLLVCESQ
jgi:hypothetical protein